MPADGISVRLRQTCSASRQEHAQINPDTMRSAPFSVSSRPDDPGETGKPGEVRGPGGRLGPGAEPLVGVRGQSPPKRGPGASPPCRS